MILGRLENYLQFYSWLSKKNRYIPTLSQYHESMCFILSYFIRARYNSPRHTSDCLRIKLELLLYDRLKRWLIEICRYKLSRIEHNVCGIFSLLLEFRIFSVQVEFLVFIPFFFCLFFLWNNFLVNLRTVLIDFG